MDGNFDIKKEARRQYFRYFRFWMIAAAVLLAIMVAVNVLRALENRRPRGNSQAPAERVYDNADVLTDEEEEQLRQYIAKLEQKSHVDLVLVTIDQPVGEDDYTWEQTMMNLADDFYDERAYGWDQAYGDGALLLDNWYEDENGSQKGSWLSTSGKMERVIGAYEEGKVFDRMDVYIDSSPYKAYRAALEQLAGYGDTSSTADGERGAGVLGAIVISAIAAIVYAVSNLRQNKAKDTTVATTYVLNGSPEMKYKADNFLRKSVTHHRINTDSGGGGSSRSGSHGGGGSYGHHSSSGGHSHGGGGRRR